MTDPTCVCDTHIKRLSSDLDSPKTQMTIFSICRAVHVVLILYFSTCKPEPNNFEILEEAEEVDQQGAKVQSFGHKIIKRSDESKEKWINDRCRETSLHHGSRPQTMHRNIEEISGKKICSSTECLG